MHSFVLAVTAAAAVGVDVGWQQTDKGDVEYIIQIEPHQLQTLKKGDVIEVGVRPDLRKVRRYRIVVGNGKLPRETAASTVDVESPAYSAKPLDGASNDYSVVVPEPQNANRPAEWQELQRTAQNPRIEISSDGSIAIPNAPSLKNAFGVGPDRGYSGEAPALRGARQPTIENSAAGDQPVLSRNPSTGSGEPGRLMVPPTFHGPPVITEARPATNDRGGRPADGVRYDDRPEGPAPSLGLADPRTGNELSADSYDDAYGQPPAVPADTTEGSFNDTRGQENSHHDGGVAAGSRYENVRNTSPSVADEPGGGRYSTRDESRYGPPYEATDSASLRNGAPLPNRPATDRLQPDLQGNGVAFGRNQASVRTATAVSPGAAEPRGSATAFGQFPNGQADHPPNDLRGGPLTTENSGHVHSGENDPSPAGQSTAGVANVNAPEDDSDRPWGLFTFTLFALFASLGGNFYLGWMNWDMRQRFRSLIRRMKFGESAPASYDDGIELDDIGRP